MDYDTFDTDIFSEINDMPGEIYDVIEYKEEGEDDKKFRCGRIYQRQIRLLSNTQVSREWTVGQSVT